MDCACPGGVMVEEPLAARTRGMDAGVASTFGRHWLVVRSSFVHRSADNVANYAGGPGVRSATSDRSADVLVCARPAFLRIVLWTDPGHCKRAGLLPAIPRARVAHVATRSSTGSGGIADAEDAIASSLPLQHVKRDYRIGARQ